MPKVVAGPPAAGVVAPNPTCAGPAAGVALADEAPKVNPVEAAGVDAALLDVPNVNPPPPAGAGGAAGAAAAAEDEVDAPNPVEVPPPWPMRASTRAFKGSTSFPLPPNVKVFAG